MNEADVVLSEADIVRKCPYSAVGVYCIRNTKNGKVYIGSASASIQKRWDTHVSRLRNGSHHSILLQRAWNKDRESITFEILLECPPEDCVRMEQEFMDRFQSHNPKFGYNISPTASSSLGVKHTLETRRKMSVAQRGRRHGPESIAKMSIASSGRVHNEEARRKNREAHLGKKHSLEARARMAAGHIGFRHSMESRMKMSAAATGKKPSAESVEKTAAANRGRKQSPESIAKRVAKLTGIKRSPEVCAAISARHKGKVISAEMRLNISLALRGRPKSAEHLAAMRLGKARAKERRAAEAAAVQALVT